MDKLLRLPTTIVKGGLAACPHHEMDQQLLHNEQCATDPPRRGHVVPPVEDAARRERCGVEQRPAHEPVWQAHEREPLAGAVHYWGEQIAEQQLDVMAADCEPQRHEG